MIIDAHVHLFDYSWIPEQWWKWLGQFYKTTRGPLLTGKTCHYIESLCDPSGERILQQMSMSGIERSIVLPLDWGISLGEPAVSIQEQHEQIAEITSRSNGRLIPFAGVDPRRKNAQQLIKKCVNEWNFKGIKLYPAAGFPLLSDQTISVLNIAREYGLPVMVHSGFAAGPSFEGVFGNPDALDSLCAKFPDVKIIAAHLGNGFLHQLCAIGATKMNFYVDCSLMQRRCKTDYYGFMHDIWYAINTMGASRILFGTDWPFGTSSLNNSSYIQAIQKFLVDDDKKFTSFEIKGILGKNAAGILGVQEKKGDPA